MEKSRQITQIQQGSSELKKLPTLEALQNQLSAMVVKNTIQAIKSNLPSVGKLKSIYGDTQIKAILVDILADFVEFVNVGKTFNGSQLAQTVQMIQQYFPHLNLADLKLFFDKMKLGHYGSFYDRMDGQLILEKMDQYNQDRMNQFENIKISLDNEIKKKDPIGANYHPDVVKALKEAVGDKKPFAAKYDVKQPSEGEVFRQRWLRQFDNLYLGNVKTNRNYSFGMGVRALKIGNTILTVQEFLELKIYNALPEDVKKEIEENNKNNFGN